MRKKWCCVLLVAINTLGLLVRGAFASGYEAQYCSDLMPQNVLDMRRLMGMWYGVEIIYHTRDDEDYNGYNRCPIIHIADFTSEVEKIRHRSYYYIYELSSKSFVRSNGAVYPNPRRPLRPGDYGYDWTTEYYGQQGNLGSTFGRSEYNYLSLRWEEEESSREYSLKVQGNRKGHWTANGSHKRLPMSLQHQSDEFSGIVQVLKAEDDHLVLTFCRRLPSTKLYTVILSRETYLDSSIVHSIHNLINRRSLPVQDIRRLCNGAANTKISFGLICAIMLFAHYFRVNKV